MQSTSRVSDWQQNVPWNNSWTACGGWAVRDSSSGRAVSSPSGWQPKIFIETGAAWMNGWFKPKMGVKWCGGQVAELPHVRNQRANLPTRTFVSSWVVWGFPTTLFELLISDAYHWLAKWLTQVSSTELDTLFTLLLNVHRQFSRQCLYFFIDVNTDTWQGGVVYPKWHSCNEMIELIVTLVCLDSHAVSPH